MELNDVRIELIVGYYYGDYNKKIIGMEKYFLF
jgi:hypothetical protein